MRPDQEVNMSVIVSVLGAGRLNFSKSDKDVLSCGCSLMQSKHFIGSVIPISTETGGHSAYMGTIFSGGLIFIQLSGMNNFVS